MLHGFAGTSRAFDGVCAALPPGRFAPLPLDLPGHGSLAASTSEHDFAATVESLLQRSPERFLLCGYSQGGRVALQVALAARERVRGLVLVSATAGIDDPQERRARRVADERLAAEIEAEGIEPFVTRWRTQPLFAHEPEEVRELAREDHRRNTPAGLAAALRGLGTGSMPSLWARLPELRMPAVVLAGRLDEKYVAIGRRLVERLSDAQLSVVAGGHGLLLESPTAVAAAIERVAARRGADTG